MSTPPAYETRGQAGGKVRSAGVPRPDDPARTFAQANGLMMSGVVVATYVQLDDVNPAFPDKTVDRVTGVYCDVLTYSSRPGLSGQLLRRVLVADSTGMHTGRIWRPRAATMDIKQGPLPAGGMRPNQMDPRFLDGDHVLVSYLDDNLFKPLITARLPHPQTGLGNEDLELPGHRQRLKLVDGSPDLFKHNGSFYGIDDQGGFVVDTTRAHDGHYDEDGTEIPGTGDANGNVSYRVKESQTFNVEVIGKAMIHGADGDLQLRLLDSNSCVRVHRDNLDADVITLDVNDADGDAHLELKKDLLTIQMSNSPNKSLVLNTSTGHLTLKLNGQTFDVGTGTESPVVTVGGTSATEFGVLFTALSTFWGQQKLELDKLIAKVAQHDAHIEVFNAHTHETPSAPGVTAIPNVPDSVNGIPVVVALADEVTVDARSVNLRLPPT